MDKVQQESLIEFFNVDLDPKTNVEYRKGSKKSFYLEKIELQDDYEGSQEECTSLKTDIDKLRTFNTNQMNQIETLKAVHTREIKSLEEVKIGQKRTIDDLEEELVKVRSTVDKLTKQQAEDQNALALAHEDVQAYKEVAAEWEHRSKSVRKIPFLGTDILSYQSDFILRFKDHTKEWNDLVSDFQNKYLPTLKEGIDSFVTRVKNVEI